ncbi:AMP-binding protein [Micromonospora sp. CA-246542]|uniref:AMP-binding protein n=1 Tax=Micromonospora sp. CA-246542 TaxID=3239959 RepID=UPI003D92CCC4
MSSTLVHAQALARPYAPALRHDGVDRDYAWLDEQARRVAAGLPDLVPGEIVVISKAATPDFIAAVIGVGFAGGAFTVVDPAWPHATIARVVATCGARYLAAHHVGDKAFAAELGLIPGHPHSNPAADPAPVEMSQTSAVFHTSGSTGTPKAVAVPHAAFVRTFAEPDYLMAGPGTAIPHLAPPHWDAGALEIFGALCTGSVLVLPDRPGANSPAEIRRLVRDRGVTTMWLTASLFNMAVDEDLDCFAGLCQLLIGGERLSVRQVRALLTAYPGIRLTNGYGPVESMVFATTHDITIDDVTDPLGIPLGRAMPGTGLHLVGADGGPVCAQEAGELWLTGSGLATGYLGEHASSPAFTRMPDGTRAYRTGDRVSLGADGLLRYHGRIDRQFKRRGVRIEPAEIEAVALGLPEVTSAHLLPTMVDGTVVEAVLYYATTTGKPAAEMDALVVRELPAHLRPDSVQHVPEMPLTPTGKTDTHALRAMSPRRHAATVEEIVAAVVSGASTLPFTDLGLNSLDAIRIANRLTLHTGAAITTSDVLTCADARSLHEYLERAPRVPSPEVLDERASAAEARFWFAERIAPAQLANLSLMRLRLTGYTDPARWRAALEEVRQLHPALRTAFVAQGSAVVRHVVEHPTPAPFSVLVPGADHRSVMRELTTTRFDLASGKLLSAALVPSSSGADLWVLVHHIAFDGWSQSIFARDLAAAYRFGRTAVQRRSPAPRLSPARRAQLTAHWQHALRGVSDLPAGSEQGPLELARDTVVTRTFRTDARLPRRASTVVLAAFARTLATSSGGDDFCVGTALAARPAGTEDEVGCHITLLPLRLHRSVTPTEVDSVLTDAMRHADLPFDEIVSAVLDRRSRRMPLFQALFLLQDDDGSGFDAGDVTVHVDHMPPLGPQAEILLELRPHSGGHEGVLQAPSTGHWAARLDEIAEELHRQLATLSPGGAR